MTIKNILVAFDGTEGAEAALRQGLRMTEKYGAHLTGLRPHGQPSAHVRRMIASHSELSKVVAQKEAAIMAESEEKFRALTRGRSDIHWIAAEGPGDSTVVEYARYFDITLIGEHEELFETTAFELHPDRIALQSGRPLLVVPRGYDRPLGDRVAIAWDGQRAAARALSDAMQILETQSSVTVLHALRDTNTGRPDERLNKQLERHGIAPEWVFIETRGRSVGDAISDWCGNNEVGLLIMGAYEHSKFREDLFGGTTNSVLRHLPVPVLLAH